MIREFDFHVRGIVRMAQGMFRLAGRDDLARRIRPILRRVLRKLEDQKAKEAEEAGEAGDGAEGNEAEPETAEAPAAENVETALSLHHPGARGAENPP